MSSEMTGGVRFAASILAKAPIAGLAKTRLIPLLGAQRAADAQWAFFESTLQTARESGAEPLTVWCAPDVLHPCFQAAARQGAVCHAQPAGDLGERLHAAAMHHFDQRPDQPLLLVGTDCPTLAASHLRLASDALRTHDAVLIPAEDGGYVLIGLARPIPIAFKRIAWSTAAVAAQTRDRFREAGVRWTELPPLWDVDQPADWARYRRLVADPMDP